MPVEFLSEEQERRYGRFAGELTREQLDKYFELDFEARDLIGKRAHLDANRLGFALQLGTVRFLGTFLENPVDVPVSVVQYLSSQLRMDAVCLPGYGEGKARWEHAARIREHYGYRDFAEPAAYFRLTRWLYTRAWVASQSPSAPGRSRWRSPLAHRPVGRLRDAERGCAADGQHQADRRQLG